MNHRMLILTHFHLQMGTNFHRQLGAGLISVPWSGCCLSQIFQEWAGSATKTLKFFPYVSVSPVVQMQKILRRLKWNESSISGSALYLQRGINVETVSFKILFYYFWKYEYCIYLVVTTHFPSSNLSDVPLVSFKFVGVCSYKVNQGSQFGDH